MRPQIADDTMRRPDPAPYLAAAAAFALGWLLLVWPWLSGRFTIPWDAKAQFLPQIQFLAGSFARGDNPSWNPFAFGGHPQIADPQSMLFSPPFLMLAAFDAHPSAWAVDATVFAMILAGGLALIAWFADRDWHPAGGAIAALAFGFGAAMAWRVQHTGQVLSLVWLSITLLLLDRALARGSWGYGIASGLTGAALVLGRDQVALIAVYLLVAYVVWRLVAARDRGLEFKSSVGPLAVGALVGLVVIALPILLTAMLAQQSNRPEIDYAGAARGSLHPALGVTFFAPDLFGSTGRMWDYWGPPSFAWDKTWGPANLNLAQNMGQLYLGAIPALLILMGLGSRALWRHDVRFFTLALGVMTLYALGGFTPFFWVAHAFLPGVDLYRRPADAVFLMGFLGAILAGYMAHTLLTHEAALSPRRLRAGLTFAAVITLAAFAAALTLAITMDHASMAARPLAISLGLFALGAAVLADAIWIHPIRPLLAAGLLIGFTVADLAYSNGPGSATARMPSAYEMLEPAAQNETIALLKRKTAETASATRRDRVELAGLGFAWPNASITHGLENTLGYNPVRLGLYSRATGAGDTVGLPEERKFTPMFPSYRSTLADLLGLRFIASGVTLDKLDPSARLEDFPLVATTPQGFIYENPRAMPRAVFATSAAPADFDTILNTGTWPDEDLSQTVLLSPDDVKDSGRIATRGRGEVAIREYSNTVVDIAVNSTRGGYVVLNDPWHPWWVATLDGQTVPILRANVLVRAVRVPYGEHNVRFTFAPIRGALRQAFGW